MKKLLLSAAAFAAVAVTAAPTIAQTASPATAQAPRGKAVTRADVSQRVQRQFARLDADRDGFITKAEADMVRGQRAQKVRQRAARTAQRDPARAFDRLDANRDNVLSRAEFDAGRAGMAQRRASRADKMGKRASRGGGFGGRLFETADANKDGRVSVQEASTTSLQRFDATDANRDGTITRDERRQRRQARKTSG